MNEAIQSRFSRGDTVYAADTEYSESLLTCPDCLGTLKWIVVFADGHAQEVQCQTCRRGYEPPCGNIRVPLYKLRIRKLTIGSIRYNDTDKAPFSYMCEETGVGSGRIYYDEDLFTNEDSARFRAQEKHELQLKHIAQNNFSKRFGGTKELEATLSTWGFSRRLQIEAAAKFRQWAGIAGITKKRK